MSTTPMITHPRRGVFTFSYTYGYSYAVGSSPSATPTAIPMLWGLHLQLHLRLFLCCGVFTFSYTYGYSYAVRSIRTSTSTVTSAATVRQLRRRISLPSPLTCIVSEGVGTLSIIAVLNVFIHKGRVYSG